MKRCLLAVVFAFTFIVPTSVIANRYDDLFKSVAQLEITRSDGYSLGSCTTGMIQEKRGLWITAAHCVLNNGTLSIGKKIATLVDADMENDIAILSIPGVSAVALPLATRAPETGDEIGIIGYPHGIGPMYTRGHISTARQQASNGLHYMFYTAVACPGSSGSPVVNTKGQIVSIHRGSMGQACAPPRAGALYTAVQRLVQKVVNRE